MSGAVENMPDLEEITDRELAEWLHLNYERNAAYHRWSTQERCTVPFRFLPDQNKEVMLQTARQIKKQFADCDEPGDRRCPSCGAGTMPVPEEYDGPAEVLCKNCEWWGDA